MNHNYQLGYVLLRNGQILASGIRVIIDTLVTENTFSGLYNYYKFPKVSN